MKQSFALPLLLAASSQASTIDARQDGCKDVHIFLARGNNEPYPGRQGKLVNAICNGLSSCDYEDIKFYNPGNSNYCAAVQEGAANGLSQMTAYNQKCPESKLVLSGFSQGANVAGDILGGGGGQIFGCTQGSNAGFSTKSGPGKMNGWMDGFYFARGDTPQRAFALSYFRFVRFFHNHPKPHNFTLLTVPI